MQKRDTIKTEVKSFLQNDPFYSELIKGEISDSHNLLDSGILDSIGVLNLIIYLENQYGFAVEIEELNENNFQNVDKIADYIVSRGPSA